MYKDANISDDRLYRYSLRRIWDMDAKEIVFIGINPSTADANTDDATITKLIGFCKRYEYGGFRIINLYAFRTTECKYLKDAVDPFGKDNWLFLSKWKGRLKTIVFMWGKNNKDFGNVREKVIEMYPNALCFGHNIDGSPVHPLLLPYSAKLIRFSNE